MHDIVWSGRLKFTRHKNCMCNIVNHCNILTNQPSELRTPYIRTILDFQRYFYTLPFLLVAMDSLYFLGRRSVSNVVLCERESISF